jgi:hypothetical protein
MAAAGLESLAAAGPNTTARAAAAAAAAGAIPLGRLFWWATVPVIKVFLMGLCGVVLARQVRCFCCWGRAAVCATLGNGTLNPKP